MSDDSPKIVSLETSLELSEFPSETDVSARSRLTFRLRQRAAPVAARSRSGRLAFAPLRPSRPLDRSVEGLTEDPVFRRPTAAHVGPATVTDFPVDRRCPQRWRCLRFRRAR